MIPGINNGQSGLTVRNTLNQLIASFNSDAAFALYDTAANFTATDPILQVRQFGIETDGLTTAPKFKIGNGVDGWNSLPYFGGETLAQVLANGNSTGGIPFTSPSGYKNLLIDDNGIQTDTDIVNFTNDYLVINHGSTYPSQSSALQGPGGNSLNNGVTLPFGGNTAVSSNSLNATPVQASSNTDNVFSTGGVNGKRNKVYQEATATTNLISLWTKVNNVFTSQMNMDGITGTVNFVLNNLKKNGVEIATITDVNNAVIGLLDDRGNYNASTNLFPATGGSGLSGAVLKGDLWTISVAGTLGGVAVTVGDVVRSLVDTPAQTSTNWTITENNIGYVPENNANKSNSILDFASTVKFPTWAANVLYFITWIKESMFSALPAKATAFIGADLIMGGDSTDAFKSKTRTFTQFVANLSSYFQPKLFKYIDTSNGVTASATGQVISQFVKIPANTLTSGTLRIKVKSIKTGGTSYCWNYIYINTANSMSGAQNLGQIQNAGFNTLDLLNVERTIPIKVGTFYRPLLNTNYGYEEMISQAVAVTVDWTVDQYILSVVQINIAPDTLTGNYFTVIQE